MSQKSKSTTINHNITVRDTQKSSNWMEEHGVDYIPDNERRSRPRNLFVILLGGSMTFGLFIIGWYPVAFGLGWWQAATAVICGSIVGAIFLGVTGLLGPNTGTTNPVTSGAYFGVAGRLIGSALEGSASLAFAAISIWTGGDALSAALFRFLHIEDQAVVRITCYAVLSVIITIISIYGHHIMVAALKFIIPTGGLCMIVGTFVYGRYFDPSYKGTGSYVFGSATGTWIVSALLSAATVLSYCAYTGDWCRHISSVEFSNRRVTWTLFIGGVIGMGGCFLWGTYISVSAFSVDPGNADKPFVLGIVGAAPMWYVPALVYLGLASGTGQAVINTYGTGLDTSAIIPRLNRVQATLIACFLATAVVYAGYFYSAISDWLAFYLEILVYCSVPWVVIVIYGHITRRGYYNVEDLQVFNRGTKGGIYWYSHGLNLPILLLWIAALITGSLFSVNDMYTGPLSHFSGGIDGGLVASGLVALIGFPIVNRVWPDAPEVYGPGFRKKLVPSGFIS